MSIDDLAAGTALRNQGPDPGDVASMHRLIGALLLAAIVSPVTATLSCGGNTKLATGPSEPSDDAGVSEHDGGEPSVATKDDCVGADIGNLEDLLLKTGCEESTSPDALTPVDLKGKLVVTATSSPTKVGLGGKADLLVTYANKSQAPLVLHFRIDPVPRFETEVWSDAAKNKAAKRADLPPGQPPPPPKGASAPAPAEARSARITLAPGGVARVRVPWEAVKTKWAPDKYVGSAPERGFPRAPAGPLPKGKYTVKVVTPLVGVSEGEARELSAPKVEIEVGP